jgi:nitrate reductase cytochrome c-type subunit
MSNDVPTILVAVMVTTQNYYYKPPVVQSNLKNVQVEKNTNCSKPTDAKPVKKVSNKLVQKKKKK